MTLGPCSRAEGKCTYHRCTLPAAERRRTRVHGTRTFGQWQASRRCKSARADRKRRAACAGMLGQQLNSRHADGAAHIRGVVARRCVVAAAKFARAWLRHGRVRHVVGRRGVEAARVGIRAQPRRADGATERDCESPITKNTRARAGRNNGAVGVQCKTARASDTCACAEWRTCVVDCA